MSNGSGVWAQDSWIPPRWVLSIGAVWGVALLMIELQELLLLFVVGYCIAYLFIPVVGAIESRGYSRVAATGAVFSGIGLAVVVAAVVVIPLIWTQGVALVERAPHFVSKLEARFGMTVLEGLSWIELHAADLSLTELVSSINVPAIVGRVVSTLLSGYSVAMTLVNGALLPFIVFYLLVDFAAIHAAVLSLFPPGTRGVVQGMALELDQYVSAFVQGQLVVGMTLAVVYSIGFLVLGLDLWLILGVLTGLLNVVPFLGVLFGIVSTTTVHLVGEGTFVGLLLLWGFMGVVQVIEGNFLTPRIVGERVGLSPLVIILMLVACGKLFGLLGLALAVPIAAALRVVGSRLFDHGGEEPTVESSNGGSVDGIS